MIENLTMEIEQLKNEVAQKQKRLDDLIMQKYKEEISLYPLSKFINETYIFDKPRKWSNPKTNILTENVVQSYRYIKFNGIVLGKELNELYHDEKNPFEDTANYVIYAIPDELYSEMCIYGEESKEGLIPLEYMHELLAVKFDK